MRNILKFSLIFIAIFSIIIYSAIPSLGASSISICNLYKKSEKQKRTKELTNYCDNKYYGEQDQGAPISFFENAKPIQKTEPVKWDKLDEGLYLGEFYSTKKSNAPISPIIILKISPKFYSFILMSASENEGKARTLKQWCNQFNAVAAINASMYLKENNLKSTGYMKNYNYFNNPDINNSFGAFMAFNPIDDSLPYVQIIDRYHQPWKKLIGKYNTVIQNYRMISLHGENVWKLTDKAYSTTAVGMDKDGNVLFIYSMSPHTTYDLNNVLLSLPIKIKNAMYVEGGQEANLYIKNQKRMSEKKEGYKSDFTEHNNKKSVWKVPNVIGIVKRKR
ncbi:MAG: phosphodiester glycosidase family protein [bacterium]